MNPAEYFNNCIGVFQGGGCKAIAYVGAYKRAHELGIMFSEVAGTSAGSIIAALIAIGATPQQIEKLIQETDFKKIVSPSVSNCNVLIKCMLMCIAEVLTIVFDIIAFLLYVLYLLYGICHNVCSYVRKKMRDWGLAKKRKTKYMSLPNPIKWHKYIRICIHTFVKNTWGVFDSASLTAQIEKWFEDCGVRREVTFADLDIALHVVSTDVYRREIRLWNAENTPEATVAKAVTSSCAIPLFFTPVDHRYVDGGVMSNRPDYLFWHEANKFTKILSFSLSSSSDHYRSRLGFVNDLISTIVEGSDKLQHDLLPTVSPKVVIPYCGIDATSFDKLNPENIQKLFSAGENALNLYLEKLDNDKKLSLITNSRGNIKTRERLYTQIAFWSYSTPKHVIVYEPTLDWVWSLFPTLLSWINGGAKVIVFTEEFNLKVNNRKQRAAIRKKYNCSPDEAKTKIEERILMRDSKVRLLKELGCRVEKYKSNKIKGFFFNFKSKPDGKAEYVGIGVKYPQEYTFLYSESISNAKIYNDEVDTSLLSDQFAVYKVSEYFKGMPTPRHVDVVGIDKKEIECKLKSIPFYENSVFEWVDKNLEELRFLNPRLRGFKYTQAIHTFTLFEDFEKFGASALKLASGKQSLIAPIIVEVHQGKFYVIKGNTRCLYAWNHGIKSLNVLVIHNVGARLPISGDITDYMIDHLFVSEDEISGKKRYGNNFDKNLYRPIDQTLRPDSDYLL